MYSLIVTGGSGLRVLEAVLHLSAMGLGPETLRVLVVDTDGSDGNLGRTRSLLSAYGKVRGQLVETGGAGLPFFKTGVELVGGSGSDAVLQAWTPGAPAQTLADLLNYELLGGTETPPEVVDLLFTRQDRALRLDQTLRGRTTVGTAAMSLLPLFADRPPWSHLIEKIRAELGDPSGSRVFMAGSVTGGAGAASLYPIARLLRASSETNADRLSIGVAALVSSAHAEGGPAGATAMPGPLAAWSAVTFFQHLRDHGDWPFDAVYWLGNGAVGDVIAAITGLEFLETPLRTGACCYAGPDQNYAPHLQNMNPVRWEDLPLAEERRERFSRASLEFLFVALIHLGFGNPLFRSRGLERRPFHVPWYFERFAMTKDWLTGGQNERALADFTTYVEDHFIPWLLELLGDDPLDPVRLFNRAALQDARDRRWEDVLQHLGELRWTDATDPSRPDNMDRFFTESVRRRGRASGETRGLAAYLGLLKDAAQPFLRDEARVHA